MFCPVCRTEYREGFDRCADCAAALEHRLAPLPEPPEGPPWIELRVVTSETEAKLIQGYLESCDVPCTLESLVFHAEPVTFGPLSKVIVHVPENRQAEAEELLDNLEVTPAEA